MMSDITIYNPQDLAAPLGQYSHVARAKAKDFLFVAGMLAVDGNGQMVGNNDFCAQTAQVFQNIHTALRSAGADWGNVVQFTTFLVHSQDLKEFMNFRLRAFPKMFTNGVYPPNTLLIVDRLVQEGFLVEVQTIAVV